MHSTEAMALSETGPSTLTASWAVTSGRQAGSKDHKPLPTKTPTVATLNNAALVDMGKRVLVRPAISRETFLNVECKYYKIKRMHSINRVTACLYWAIHRSWHVKILDMRFARGFVKTEESTAIHIHYALRHCAHARKTNPHRIICLRRHCCCRACFELSAQNASTNRNVTRLTQHSPGKHFVLPPKFPQHTKCGTGTEQIH